MDNGKLVQNLILGLSKDVRLSTYHIVLLVAIISSSIEQETLCQIKISRRLLMERARIRSSSTYHKCLNELVSFNYCIYYPSYDPIRKSSISILYSG